MGNMVPDRAGAVGTPREIGCRIMIAGMENDSLTFAAQAKALRETRDAWLEGERKSLGAEQFEQAESGTDVALAELKGTIR